MLKSNTSATNGRHAPVSVGEILFMSKASYPKALPIAFSRANLDLFDLCSMGLTQYW